MKRKRVTHGVIVLMIVAAAVFLLLEGSRVELLRIFDRVSASAASKRSATTDSYDTPDTLRRGHPESAFRVASHVQESEEKQIKKPWPPKKDQRATIRPPPVKHPSKKLASVPLYQLWNHETQRLDLPHARPDNYAGPLSSLEILQNVLKSVDSWEAEPNPADTCFLPATDETRALALQLAGSHGKLSFPIIYVGMPKAGSTSLYSFFQCAGIRSSHVQNGKQMKDLVDAGSPRPLSDSHSIRPQPQAYLQLDYNFDECVYPQIQFLDEIHQEFPHATLILNFRPVSDWIRSAQSWFDMAERWQSCHLPGLVCTGPTNQKGHPSCTEENLAQWWCGHVHHIREFVRHYPTHQLVEIDLYDSMGTAQVLSQLFGVAEEASCWGNANRHEDVYGAVP